MARAQLKRDAWLAVLCLVAYLAAYLWAKQFSLPGSILIWFPPAGVAIGFCYLRPRLVAVVIAGEFLATSFITSMAGEFGVGGLIVNSFGIALSYGLAGAALRHFDLDPRLRSADDLLLLAAAALVIGSVPAAAVGVGVQAWVGLVDNAEIAESIAIFWLGDAIGAICVAPFIVLVGSAVLHREKLPFTDRDTSRWGQRLLVVEYATPSIVGFLLFSLGSYPLRFAYLAFVPVVLIAVRHGIAGAVLSSAAMAAILAVGAHLELGGTVERSDFQVLVLTLTLTGLIVGAVVSARHDVLRVKSRLGEIIAATPDLVASVTRDGTVSYVNGAGRVLMGLGAIERPTEGAFTYLADDLGRHLMREGMRTAELEGTWRGDNRLRRADGTVIPVSQVLIAHRHLDDDDISFSVVCRDTTDAHRLEDQLRRATLYDDTTGLPNRALLAEHLERLDASGAWAGTAAVLFCDVTGLDEVNETWGFDVGESLLATLGQCLRATVAAGDLVARYGGAQFVVVMAATDDEIEPVHLAERLVARLAEPVEVEGHVVRITGSVGVSIVEADQAPFDTLRSAEIALHRAREAGGGRYTIFEADLASHNRHRIEVAADLQDVIETGAWWLEYQPIVEVGSRAVRGAEALLRWSHPERGPVSPFELIRRAETSGVIVELGREILERACGTARRWQDDGFDVGVSVNVSARQLHEDRFVDDVRGVLAETGLAPARLTVELTETILLADGAAAISKLQAVRTLGCRVALDDFGTGYSSLSELLELPIDVVKLDQAFIRLLDTSPRAAAMVETLVRLADDLGLTVVAEGVERESQAALLDDMGCPLLQGFVLSPSVAADTFASLLRSSSGGEHAGARS